MNSWSCISKGQTDYERYTWKQTCKMSPSTPSRWCKIFRFWLNLVTERMVFFCKFYLLLEFSIFFIKCFRKWRAYYFKSNFCELMGIYKCISVILICCVLLLTLLCRKSRLYGRSRQWSRPIGSRCSMGLGRNPQKNGLIQQTLKFTVIPFD